VPVGGYPEDELEVISPVPVGPTVVVPFDGKGVIVEDDDSVALVNDETVELVARVAADVGAGEVALPVALANEPELGREKAVEVALGAPPLLPEVPMLAQVVTVAEREDHPVGGKSVFVGLEELPALAPARRLEVAVVETTDPDAEPSARVVSLEEAIDPELEPDLADPLLPVCRLDTPGLVNEVPRGVESVELVLEMELGAVPGARELEFPNAAVEDNVPVANVRDKPVLEVPLMASPKDVAVVEVSVALPKPVVKFPTVVGTARRIRQRRHERFRAGKTESLPAKELVVLVVPAPLEVDGGGCG